MCIAYLGTRGKDYARAMRGAIAAGHPLTAEVGARVLEAGGNAVDACLAASFASWVTESPLTGPGGGGFMLVHLARDRRTRVLDFYVAVPSGRGGGMDEMTVDFSGGDTQIFRIGAASVAVPGAVAGLEEAHRRFATLPWRELFAPAIELARDGVEITRAQAYLHAILDVILRHTEEGRRLFGGDASLAAGERLVQPDLASSLALLAEGGAAALYRGDLARELVRYLKQEGGALTLKDLREYRVIRRRPVSAPFRGYDFRSNPPPATGGALVAYGLKLLDSGDVTLARLVEAMREQRRARELLFRRLLYRGGLAKRLLGVGGTTHISVVDARGNAASLSISTGAGSGVVVPGTGFALNNMLGEYNVVETGPLPRPGVRLTSLMAPSIALEGGRPRLVLGSAGSLRLWGAIMQVTVNVLARGLGVKEAIERPRLHVEGEDVHCEGGTPAEEMDRLEELGHAVTRWRRRNLYFGGVSAVELLADGSLAAAGDPRRGGHGIVVG
jgi:gamma-glutamyltranspeptidase/glutathione hydrolase